MGEITLICAFVVAVVGGILGIAAFWDKCVQHEREEYIRYLIR